MDEDQKHEIYQNECGSYCPHDETDCPYRGDEGICELEEPWFDCDDFIHEHAEEIQEAEEEIARLEEDEED